MRGSGRYNRAYMFDIASIRVIMPVLLTMVSAQAMAQPVTSPLAGMWKITGWEAKSAANPVIRPYGDHPGGYYYFSAGGHFMFMMAGDNRNTPPPGPLTDGVAARLFATMAALDGTYKVDGDNKFVIHVEHSWNQSWTGTNQNRDFRIDGNRLTITFTAKNVAGEELFATINAERAE